VVMMVRLAVAHSVAPFPGRVLSGENLAKVS
jgi:hypothetical protein